MARYSSEHKDAILKKLLPPQSMSVAEVARQESISAKTLYHWRDQARKLGLPVPGKTSSTEDWSAETKLAVIVETAYRQEFLLVALFIITCDVGMFLDHAAEDIARNVAVRM